jgi:twitching motility protein PilI
MMQPDEDTLELEQRRKSGRLRDFSNQLAERLRQAPSQRPEPARLAARLGEAAFLFDMSTTGEIVPMPEIAPVPWTKSWFRGLANVRGRLVGVIDLMQLSGRPPMTPEQSLQLIVFGEVLKVNAAVLVTRAFGLRNIKDLEALGAVSDPTRPWELELFREADGNTLIEIDLRRLVAAERFSAIGL